MIEVRIRFGNGARKRFEVATEARRDSLRALARQIALANVDHERAARMLADAASATDGEFKAISALVAELGSGQSKPKPKATAHTGSANTFRALAEKWVTGKLHQQWPDHVKLKRTADHDEGRLELLFETIGNVELTAFTLADAERAMAALPEGLSRSTRRHYGQLISKVLRLAVYPCKLIERSPLPDGFLPKTSAGKAKTYLYPDEDAALLACDRVPLARRALWGFLAREGCRLGEALALTWSDVDLTRGAIRLDENKTDDPRAWALSPGVASTFRQLKPEGVRADALVFANAFDCASDKDHAARAFRKDLERAGIDRAELFESTERRQPVRVHDLRGTFVTLNLANGKTETWVADRTGHKSSTMINRYRRAARSAAELGLGELLPLAQAIPEFRPMPGPKGGPSELNCLAISSLGIVLTSCFSAENDSEARVSQLCEGGDLKTLTHPRPLVFRGEVPPP